MKYLFRCNCKAQTISNILTIAGYDNRVNDCWIDVYPRTVHQLVNQTEFINDASKEAFNELPKCYI